MWYLTKHFQQSTEADNCGWSTDNPEYEGCTWVSSLKSFVFQGTMLRLLQTLANELLATYDRILITAQATMFVLQLQHHEDHTDRRTYSWSLPSPWFTLHDSYNEDPTSGEKRSIDYEDTMTQAVLVIKVIWHVAFFIGERIMKLMNFLWSVVIPFVCSESVEMKYIACNSKYNVTQ